jgi:hypothetical protein
MMQATALQETNLRLRRLQKQARHFRPASCQHQRRPQQTCPTDILAIPAAQNLDRNFFEMNAKIGAIAHLPRERQPSGGGQEGDARYDAAVACFETETYTNGVL